MRLINEKSCWISIYNAFNFFFNDAFITWRYVSYSKKLLLGFCCISSSPRQYAAPAAQQQYYYQPNYPYGAPNQYGAPAAGGVRYAAAGASNLESVQPIASGSSGISERLFGPNVRLSEFSSSGYNAEGGGPVSQSKKFLN